MKFQPIFLKSLYFLQTLTLLVNSRALSQNLLNVEDSLSIYKDGESIAQFELWPFPFIEAFTVNTTISGDLCYAQTLKQFIDFCYEKDVEQQKEWIIVTPFDYVNTNEMLNEIYLYNVLGIILGTETQIDSGGYYSKPKIITLISQSRLSELAEFAQPFSVNVTAVLKHDYITNCQSLNMVQSYLFTLICGYGLLIVSWIIGIWGLNDDSHNTLQKAILIIPLFNIIRVFLYAMYIGDCPWSDQLTGRYLLMALVTVSTIYHTVFVSILILISKGWILIRGSLSRQQATSTTMLMGAVYLTYSAFYVSSHVESIKFLMTMMLNLIYLFLFYIVGRNAMNVLTVLQMHFSIISNNDVLSLQDTIQLKISMIKKFIFIIVVFFLFEIIANGMVPLFTNSDDVFSPSTTLIHFFFEFYIIFSLMFVFRPRAWPEYFNLGVLDVQFIGMGFNQFQNDEVRQSHVIAPLCTVKLHENLKSISQSCLSDYSFNSNDQVIIFNPLFESGNSYDKDPNIMTSVCEYQSLGDDNPEDIRKSLIQKSMSNLNNDTDPRRVIRFMRSIQFATQDQISKLFKRKNE